jgi:hypothetical protein
VRSDAGPDKISFPANHKAGVLYTIVDRYDVKQYRELYASPEAVQAARDGKPLPPGTVLTLVQYKAQVDAKGNPVKNDKGRFLKGDLIAYAVMEKRAGWGAGYPDDLRNGEREYAVFGPDSTLNAKASGARLRGDVDERRRLAAPGHVPQGAAALAHPGQGAEPFPDVRRRRDV